MKPIPKNTPPPLPGFSPAVWGPLNACALMTQRRDVSAFNPQQSVVGWLDIMDGGSDELIYSLRLGSEIFELNEDMFTVNTTTTAMEWVKERHTPNLTALTRTVHAANIKWWQDPNTGEPVERNRGELLALIHSEVSEALEGERKGLMDDKLPQYPMAPVEIVDTIIRCLDYLGGFYPDLDIQEIFDAKMAYNAGRKDHSHSARIEEGGKKF